ncbi:MAG: hypothetical protein KGL39_54940 [Patescibacteria group bacterium]|nr:hypothetical protein [Patescibacteria group bacterium]
MTTISPYTPTPFSTPVANPAVGGSGTPYPYVSNSQFDFAPTGVDTSNLYPGGSAQQQAQVLADVLRRSSAWADRIAFGADPAAKGASLCATLSVEVAEVPILNGEIRLVCDYKPIIQINGVDTGPNMGALSGIGDNVAGQIRIGRRTIYVPMWAQGVRNNDVGNPNPYNTLSGKVVAVWSYVNGYPHTQLVSNITAATSICTVQPTDGASGLLGIIPNQSQFTIVDGANTESFTVQAVGSTVVSGITYPTLTSVTPFKNSHIVPTAPDFLPVTSLPADVSQAVIFLTTALIKTEGDNSLVLEELTEPKQVQKEYGDEFTDVTFAMKMLHSFGVRTKQKV